jgi:hypothetical protein
MIFGNQLRSSKTTALFVGAVIFIAIFLGLVYNHVDFSDASTPVVDDSNVVAPPQKQPETHQEQKPDEPIQMDDTPHDLPADTAPPKSEEDDKAVRPPPQTDDPSTIPEMPMNDVLKFYFDRMVKAQDVVHSRKYTAWGGVDYEIPEDKPLRWKEPSKEKICIIDLDNRPFNETGEIFGPTKMSWDRPNEVHGLSMGLLNHWVYAKIHGYKYYYVTFDNYEDRRASWKKPPIMSQILKDHDACLYLDSDAVFNHLDLPFEWLMNYWGLHHTNNSMALAYDPGSDNNKDEFGQVYLNTGFIVAQNNKKTFEIMKEWQGCPEEDGRHPDCVKFRTAGPGRPTDQGGFGTYTRYDYQEHIKSLKCTEANGFPESHSGCDGTFIRHLWTGKGSWIKAVVGAQMPGPYLEEIHQRFLDEKPSFYISEKELMKGKRD